MHPIKALTVDFGLIIQSMRDVTRESNDYYLDKRSGRVLPLSRDLIRSLARDGFEGRDGLPEWDACMIPIAREIVLNAAPHFVRVPEAFGRPEHRMRVAFTETVSSVPLKQKLKLALRGRGSCKRFKECLQADPLEMLRWETFCGRLWREKVAGWLEGIGILAVEEKPKTRASAG